MFAMSDPERSPADPVSVNRLLQVGLLMGAGAAFVVLAWTSQRGLGLLWDEQVDLEIAAALLDHPLYGSGADGSQMRLPMAVNALAFALGGPSLHLSRAISILVGLAAILTTFGLCRRLFGGWTALLAAALVAFSPYFLAFARIAMTEGDVFPALFVTLACWAYLHYADRPHGPRLALAAVILGLAIAAKLYALFLVPVFGMCEVIAGRRHVHVGRTSSRTAAVMASGSSSGWLGFAVLGCLALAATSAGLAQVRQVAASIVVWVLLLTATAAVVIALVRRRRWRPARRTGWVVMSLLAMAVTCAAIPQHVIHPDILRTIARRTVYWDHLVPGALWSDHLRLYAGVILIDGTMPVGVASLAAIVWAWFREKDEPALRLPVFAVSFFILAIATLPLRQTFYLMSVYPLVAILTAAWLRAVSRWLHRTWRAARPVWSVLIVVIVGQAVYAAAAAWPDYNLYARRWVGAQWLGAEARGYRNLVQTPCDGYAELVQWCLEYAQPGQRVVSYLWADHVLDRLLPTDLPFTLIRRGVYHAADRGLPQPDPPAIDQADYVLVHINNFIAYDDAPPPDQLARYFGGRPAYVVYRDGDFPMAVVYRRRGPTQTVTSRPVSSGPGRNTSLHTR